MTALISMLRGINVSGQKMIKMPELQRLYESLGLVNVRTYVQSGNVVFDSQGQDTSILAKQIEDQIEQSFGYDVPVFIRDKDDFRRIIDSNPFLLVGTEDPANLYVTFLYSSPSRISLDDLVNPGSDGDRFVAGQREIFIFCPNGYGRTKINNTFFERKLGMPATTRNWKTVNTLLSMLS